MNDQVLALSLLFLAIGCSTVPGASIPAYEGDPVPAPASGTVAATYAEPVPAVPVPVVPVPVVPVKGSVSADAPAPTRGRITLLLAQRMLDGDFWEPVEDQPAIGIDVSFENPEHVIGWEIGIMASKDDGEFLGLDVEGKTGELYGGVRKTFGGPDQDVKPYLAGGLSIIKAEGELSGISDDDTSLAGYLHGGVLGQFTDRFFMGLDLRVLFASDIELAGVSGDADYTQLGLVLGWGF